MSSSSSSRSSGSSSQSSVSRRRFLRDLAAGAAAGTVAVASPLYGATRHESTRRESVRPESAPPGRTPVGQDAEVVTVTGARTPSDLGPMLPHEHVLVDFAGAEVVSPDRYDRAEVIEAALPHLEALRDAGGETLVECTPAYLGRDVHVLQELSRRTGIRILSNTGYYGANGDRHLPEHAYEESADRLADRWTAEWETGIDGTDVRPGFIKIGVDPQPLSAVDRKLVRAACRTHLETGLTIAAHTGPAVPAFEQLAVLEEEGVDPAAWIWVHAQNESDRDRHVEAARRGGWVEFDGYESEQTEEYVQILQDMREAEVLGRVLISQDNGWYHVGEPGGGTFQPYDVLLTELVPRLREEGFSEEEVRMLTIENPARAFSRRVRVAE